MFPIEINISDLQLFSGAVVLMSAAHCFCSKSGSPFYRDLGIVMCGRRKAGRAARGFPHLLSLDRLQGLHTHHHASWAGQSPAVADSLPFFMSGVFSQKFLASNKHGGTKFIAEVFCREQPGDLHLPMQASC